MASTSDDENDRHHMAKELVRDAGSSEDTKMAENENIVHQQQSSSAPHPPALPRRPTTIEEEDDEHMTAAAGSMTLSRGSLRPKLQSKATTAVSQVDIHSVEAGGGTPGSSPRPSRRGTSVRMASSEDDDSASILSVQPLGSSQGGGDVESLLGEALEGSSGVHDDGEQQQHHEPSRSTLVEETLQYEHDHLDDAFPTEFDEIYDTRSNENDDDVAKGTGTERRPGDDAGQTEVEPTQAHDMDRDDDARPETTDEEHGQLHHGEEKAEANQREADDKTAANPRETESKAKPNQRTQDKQSSQEHRDQIAAAKWRAKLKHYLILSSAGKPIYSRHGDDQLISSTIGVVQTIISFYQSVQDTLKGFTAGDARFVILSKGHLHLLAVSRLGESDGQLRTQLEALYMQILSTLTLPTMEKIFIKRPSTDLRRPLQGTEGLISSLADGFTRGSPSVLLSAIECLRIRKAHRQIIHSTMLKCRSPNLLYGLVAADGRLAAVVRPKKHSLHPGDLQLVFNMLFEADSIRAGGGESWIPVCLPGFNNTGYLYMYVSFLDPGTGTNAQTGAESAATADDKPAEQFNITTESSKQVAVVLISAHHDAFDELRSMRDKLVSQLHSNGSLAHIRRAMADGRSSCTSILQTGQSKANQDHSPAETIAHFLYKSRANVQFVMPSAAPLFASPVPWRRLMSLYARLHASLHGKASHLKLVHVVTSSAAALAWTTPTFDIYVVAGRRASKPMLARAATRIVDWARREGERLFVVGGAVF